MGNEAMFSKDIAPIVEELRNHRNTVVVHCRTGQRRSPSLIAAILITAGGMTLQQAATLLESHKDLRGRENLKQPVHQIGHQQRARFPVSGVLGFFSKGHPVPNLRNFDKYFWLHRLRPGRPRWP